jgi:hypothetical protein
MRPSMRTFRTNSRTRAERSSLGLSSRKRTTVSTSCSKPLLVNSARSSRVSTAERPGARPWVLTPTLRCPARATPTCENVLCPGWSTAQNITLFWRALGPRRSTQFWFRSATTTSHWPSRSVGLGAPTRNEMPGIASFSPASVGLSSGVTTVTWAPACARSEARRDASSV